MTLSSDSWLSQIIGKPSFNLVESEGNDWYVQDEIPDGEAFISAKIPFSETEKLPPLLNQGFVLMDVNVTLYREGGCFKPFNGDTRFAELKDQNSIMNIAAASLTKNRFSYDPDISSQTSEKIKSEWVRSFFNQSRGDHMIVTQVDGKVVGFLLIILKESRLIIDLIALDHSHEGKGLAGHMIAFAHKQCGLIDPPIIVGTSFLNIKSLGFYARLGFKKHQLSYLLHKHVRINEN